MGGTPQPRFQRLVDEALAQPFAGWDFGWLKNRFSVAPLSWNYQELLKERLTSAQSLLDLCTGGGELLASTDGLPQITFATEGFAPNVPVARRRLEPLGVKVVDVQPNAHLPLPDGAFDLISNRHGAYSPAELRRVAKSPGAWFLTQQVGAQNAAGLNAALGAPAPTMEEWCLDIVIKQLECVGFKVIRSAEEFPPMTFTDIGALVFYLKAVPWQVPNFEISAHLNSLLSVHNEIERRGQFTVDAHRFFVEATLQ